MRYAEGPSLHTPTSVLKKSDDDARKLTVRVFLMSLAKTLETTGDLLARTEFAGFLENILLNKLAAADVAKFGRLASRP